MDNGNEPATKQDVVNAVKASEDRVIETMRDMQTELLKAFYSFADSNNQRLQQAEGNQAAFNSRLATLEQRILEVEKRLNIPPAA